MTFLVIDVETTGLNPHLDKLHGLAVAWGDTEDESNYYTAGNIPPEVLNALADESIPKVGHNLRFDLKFLSQSGIVVAGETHDTRLLAHILDENSSTGLKELTEYYLGIDRLSNKAEMDKACASIDAKHVGELCAEDLINVGRFTDIISRYAQEDVRNTYSLFLLLSAKLDSNADLVNYYLNEAQPFERVLLKLEQRGIAVNESIFDKYGVILLEEQGQLEDAMYDLAGKQIANVEEKLYQRALLKRKSAKGKAKVERSSDQFDTKFSFASGDHVGSLLYEELELPVKRTKNGKYATGEDVLIELASKAPDFIELFLKWRGVQKLITTYVDGMRDHIIPSAQGPRIFASYGQYTATARTHSSEPNMQNLPRGNFMKRAFVPEPGKLFGYFDYSQVELRIAAHLSQDETMVEQFQLGLDPHRTTAMGAFGVEQVTDEQRQAGKTLNFLLIYDGGPMRLQQELAGVGLEYTLEQCKDFKRAYFDQYPIYRRYLQNQLKLMKEFGALQSETGRIRRLEDIKFGSYLDWRTQSFTGPAALVDELKEYPGQHMTAPLIFEKASRRFSHAKKQGYNYPVQHLGAHIMKCALMKLADAGYDIVTTVHDSVVVQIETAEQIDLIRKIMETAYPLSVPLKVDAKILNSLDEKDIFVPDTLHKMSCVI